MRRLLLRSGYKLPVSSVGLSRNHEGGWHVHKTWDEIPEEEPDEFDLKMLADIETNPDCKEFISQDELLNSFKRG